MNDRIRLLVDGLTKPLQYPILLSSEVDRLNNNTSILSSHTSLLRSQGRLKKGYIDWEEGIEELKDYGRNESTHNNIFFIFQLLTERMRNNNSIIRLLSLYLSEIFFIRSTKFRQLFLNWLNEYIELTIGLTNRGLIISLPNPIEAADKLKSHSILLLQQWDEKYGMKNKMLQLAYKYVRNHLNLPDQNKIKKTQEEMEVKMKSSQERINRVQYEKLLREFANEEKYIKDCIETIQNCIHLLLPSTQEWIEQVEEEEEEDTSNEKRILTSNNINSNDNSSDSCNIDDNENIEWVEEVEDCDDKGDLTERTSELSADNNNNNQLNEEFVDSSIVWNDNEYYDIDDSKEPNSNERISEESFTSSSSNSSSTYSSSSTSSSSSFYQLSGLGSNNYSLSITFDSNFSLLENNDNSFIFSSIKDCLSLIKKNYLPNIKRWRKIIQNVQLPQITSATNDDQKIQYSYFINQHKEINRKTQQLEEKLYQQLIRVENLKLSSTLTPNIDTTSVREEEEKNQNQLTEYQNSFIINDNAIPTVDAKPDENKVSAQFLNDLQNKRRSAIEKIERYRNLTMKRRSKSTQGDESTKRKKLS